jgi:hypothetical protein
MPWIHKDRAREEDTIMHKNGLSALQVLRDEVFFERYLNLIS